MAADYHIRLGPVLRFVPDIKPHLLFCRGCVSAVRDTGSPYLVFEMDYRIRSLRLKEVIAVDGAFQQVGYVLLPIFLFAGMVRRSVRYQVLLCLKHCKGFSGHVALLAAVSGKQFGSSACLPLTVYCIPVMDEPVNALELLCPFTEISPEFPLNLPRLGTLSHPPLRRGKSC